MSLYGTMVGQSVGHHSDRHTWLRCHNMSHIRYLSTLRRHSPYGQRTEYHLLAGHHSVMSQMFFRNPNPNFRNWIIARGNCFTKTCFVALRLFMIIVREMRQIKTQNYCLHFQTCCWIRFRIWFRIYYLNPYCICFFIFDAKLVAFLALGWHNYLM